MGELRLRDLGGGEAIPQWCCVSWAHCEECGSELWGPGDADEKLYDGDPLVCPDCGMVHWMQADSDGWSVAVGEALRETALLGLRRLLPFDYKAKA